MRALSLFALATATAGLAAAPLLSQGGSGNNSVELGAEDLLSLYYAELRAEGGLPVAPPNVSLAPESTITRLAFGSCNHQLRSQHMWGQISATNPDLFLFIGDNNYGDNGWSGDASLTSLREAYAVQAATPELSEFRAQIPMMVTWDDHDYGMNDGGGNFAFRGWAETLFETFWGSSEEAPVSYTHLTLPTIYSV